MANYLNLRCSDFAEKVPYNHTETDYMAREHGHELSERRRRSPDCSGNVPYSDLESGLDNDRDSGRR